MKKHPYERVADRELAKWGARVVDRLITRGGHKRLVLEYRGQQRFVVYPSTPKCAPSGRRNHIQDIRRVLRQIDERKAT